MLKLKLQYFGHLMGRANYLEKILVLGKTEGRRRRGRQRKEMVGWHHWLNGHESEQTQEDGDGQGSLACCSSKSWTWLSNWAVTTRPMMPALRPCVEGHALIGDSPFSPGWLHLDSGLLETVDQGSWRELIKENDSLLSALSFWFLRFWIGGWNLYIENAS